MPGMTTYWPGTDIPKSEDNAFTLGYGNKPHGYTPGPAKAIEAKPRHRPGGFGNNTGTIAGMGPKPSQAFTIVRKKTGAMV